LYATSTREGLGSSHPIEAPEIEILVAVCNFVHSVHIADDSDGTNTEWGGERGILAVIYGALKNGADNAVMESEGIWLDTTFSLFSV